MKTTQKLPLIYTIITIIVFIKDHTFMKKHIDYDLSAIFTPNIRFRYFSFLKTCLIAAKK